MTVFIILLLYVLYVGRRVRLGSRGPSVIVQCRDGHLFTTVWIPGISLKAVRLGPLRYQYCPVGEHWVFVRIVNPADLTEEQRQFADMHHDSRIL